VLRSQVGELFYITHVTNVTGILRSGILSHNRAQRVLHAKVDLQTVQDIRARVPVSRTRMLHDHANLYVCGRNAMMYYVQANNPINEICLLRVSPDVLDLDEVVVTDGNAARQPGTKFSDAASGIAALDFDRVHDEFWIHHPTEAERYEHKRVKQAEVLVPDFVDPALIIGAYAPTLTAATAVEAAARGALPVVVAKYPFFRGLKGT
jgi:hypothetical protein